MGLLLLHLQHQDQARVLVAQEVEQEDQEVVDDVGLVALPAGVHVDRHARVPQGQPLDRDRDRVGPTPGNRTSESGEVLFTEISRARLVL